MVTFSDSVSLQVAVDGCPLVESIATISDRTDGMGSTFRFAHCRIQPLSEKNFSIVLENKETSTTTSFMYAGMDGQVFTFGCLPVGWPNSRLAVSGVAKGVPSGISLRFPSSEIMDQEPHEIRVCVGVWRVGCRGVTLMTVRFLFGKGYEMQVEPVQESEFRLMAKAQGLVDLTLGPNVAPDIVQPDSMGRWIESLEFKLDGLHAVAERYQKGQALPPAGAAFSVLKKIAGLTKLWYPIFKSWKWLLKPESVV